MKLKKIKIENFKSIKDLQIQIEAYGSGASESNTAILVGLNESGKSAILEAISLIDLGLEEISYSDYCSIDSQEENKYIDIYAYYEIENQYLWRTKINSTLKLGVEFCNRINILNIEKNVYKNGETKGSTSYKVQINDDLPFYNYVIIETVKTVNGVSQTSKTIELLSKINNITEPINEENAKNFLTEGQKLLERSSLEEWIAKKLESFIEQQSPKIQLWKPRPEYLINEIIDLNEFKEDTSISVPLRNIFYLCGKTSDAEIKKSIDKALSSQARCDEMQDKMSDVVTKYINNIWKEHKIKIRVSINSEKCEVQVEDKDRKYAYYTMNQRSDGFKQFVSLILSISAQNRSEVLKNNIILIDEPEVHLHPSGIKYMKDEILKIGKNNIVFISTHSQYMIDTNVPERHYIVSKNKSNTVISQLTESITFADDSVLLSAFGLNFYKELLPKYIFVLEGDDDKAIISHCLNLLYDKFFCSIKSAGGASKMPGFARLLSDENINALLIFDADKEGQDNKKRILTDQKDHYSNDNVFTIKDIITSLPTESTIEDLLPLDYVKSVFERELSSTFTLNNTEAVIAQIKGQNHLIKTDKQKLDSIKNKLSKQFCREFNLEKIKRNSLLTDFITQLKEKAETLVDE